MEISIVSDSLNCSEGLGEGYDGDIAFASALETFGGGHNDPISVAFGGMFIHHSIIIDKKKIIVLSGSLFVSANADKS